MSPPKRPWLRLYTETYADPKIRVLKPEHRWLFMVALMLARMSPKPGWLLIDEADAHDVHTVSDAASMSPQVVRAGMARLVSKGLLGTSGGVWFVPKWDERQYESDHSADRVKRHRSRADVTAKGRYMKRERNAPESESESETELVEVVSQSKTGPSPALTDDSRKRALALGLNPDVEWLKCVAWYAKRDEPVRDWNAVFDAWLARARPAPALEVVRCAECHGTTRVVRNGEVLSCPSCRSVA